MESQSSKHQILDIRRLTGIPETKVAESLKNKECSFDRFRCFCLHQGELPTADQQRVLHDQEINGQPYDFPTQNMIDRLTGKIHRSCSNEKFIKTSFKCTPIFNENGLPPITIHEGSKIHDLEGNFLGVGLIGENGQPVVPYELFKKGCETRRKIETWINRN